MRWTVLSSALTLAFVSTGAWAEDPKPIGPEEAAKKVNETVVLRMEVKSASLSGNVGFLNSAASHRDEKNFVVFLGSKLLSQFRDSDIEDPIAHFKGKTIEVKGKVTLHREKPQIILDSMKSIKIVDEKERSKPSGE